MKTLLAAIIFTITFSGCGVIFSTPEVWTSPQDKKYQFNAEYRSGVTGRQIVIFCNGKPIMSAKAHYWSKRLTMTAELDGEPVSAMCGGQEATKMCIISVSGKPIANLKF